MINELLFNTDKIFNSLVLIIITVFLIIKGYQYYKIKWPEKYFGPKDKASIFFSTSPFYYIYFRLFPVFAAIFICIGTIYKANPQKLINPIILGAITSFLYSVITDGRAIKDLFLNSVNIKIFLNKTSQYFIHFLTILLLTLVGGFSGLLITVAQFQFLIPKLDGLVDNIWASFISIILAYTLYSLIKKPKEIELNDVIEKSSKKINISLIRFIESLSIKNNADPILVKSICLAENIERPMWLRRIEKIFGYFKKSGSYGIMQIRSNKPLSDTDSIKKAIEKYFKNSAEMNFNQKIKLVEHYNFDQEYIFLIEEIYRFICPEM